MKHTLQIRVSKKPVNSGAVSVRNVSVRERFMRFLLGDKVRLTVIVPGSTVDVYRPLVYICSPYAGDVERNVNMARLYSCFAVRNTCIPITPHLLYPQFMDDGSPAERELALFMGMVLLTKCEQVWVFGSVISSGMRAEIAKAEKKNIPVRYFTEELEEMPCAN